MMLSMVHRPGVQRSTAALGHQLPRLRDTRRRQARIVHSVNRRICSLCPFPEPASGETDYCGPKPERLRRLATLVVDVFAVVEHGLEEKRYFIVPDFVA